MKQTIYKVQGMTCGGCVRGLTNALVRAGIEADVDLDSASATVRGDHERDAVRKAVEAAGFTFKGEAQAP